MLGCCSWSSEASYTRKAHGS